MLGLRETRRHASEQGRFTLIYLAAPGDEAAEVELTHNWDEAGYDGGRNFGHVAYRVDDIYALCQKLMAAGITINRPPRDGHMAFVRTPDGIFDRAVAKGRSLALNRTLGIDANTGSW